MIEEEKEPKSAKKVDVSEDDLKIIKQALKDFKACEENDSDNRDRALEDLRCGRLGEQWPEEVRRKREKEGRPCLTINVMPSNIRQVVNDARQNKPSIKVLRCVWRNDTRRRKTGTSSVHPGIPGD